MQSSRASNTIYDTIRYKYILRSRRICYAATSNNVQHMLCNWEHSVWIWIRKTTLNSSQAKGKSCLTIYAFIRWLAPWSFNTRTRKQKCPRSLLRYVYYIFNIMWPLINKSNYFSEFHEDLTRWKRYNNTWSSCLRKEPHYFLKNHQILVREDIFFMFDWFCINK